MSTYVMSDIHGNKKQFNEMLTKINFNINNDTLYLLGDYVDWGVDPMGLIIQLIEMSKHENIICLLGNHDKMMYESVLKIPILDSIVEGKKPNISEQRAFGKILMWFKNGGEYTLKQYLKLNKEERNSVRRWVNSLRYFISDVEINGKKFYLCHSKPLLNGMELDDVLWDRMKDNSLSSQFIEQFPNTTLISGHTIVKYFDSVNEEGKCRIYKSKVEPYINIDCGAKAFEQRNYASLGCIRLEDMAEFYIDE